MLVDVVPMRDQGVKIAQDDLRLTTPVRGHVTLRLVVVRRTGFGVDEKIERTVRASVLGYPDEHDDDLLPPLREARIERMESDSFVVTGLEAGHPQAWWCRLPS